MRCFNTRFCISVYSPCHQNVCLELLKTFVAQHWAWACFFVSRMMMVTIWKMSVKSSSYPLLIILIKYKWNKNNPYFGQLVWFDSSTCNLLRFGLFEPIMYKYMSDPRLKEIDKLHHKNSFNHNRLFPIKIFYKYFDN